MLFLTDNFSFSWLESKTDSTIKTKVIEAPEAQRIMNGNDWHVSFVSGQMKMAISTELGFRFDEDVTINLRSGDKLIVSSFSEFDAYKDHAISMFSENFPDEMKSSFLLLEVS